MLDRILSFFGGRAAATAPGAPALHAGALPPRTSFNNRGVNISVPATYTDDPVPRYPERSPAVPAVPPLDLLGTQQDTVQSLRQSLGLTREEFAERVEPVLLRYAERVHLLPASEADHHCGRGGMLRHGLEAAFFAARLCEGKVWAFDAMAEYRKTLDPKWRLATVFAALLHDLGKVVVDVNAVDESGELQWSGHGPSLWEWLTRNKLQAYYIYWRPGPRSMRHVAYGPVLLREIVGPELLDHLSSDGGHEIINRLVTAFTHPDDRTNAIAEIAHKADRASADFDLEDQARRIAAAGGSPLRTHVGMLSRAMTGLIEDGTWNLTKTGPLFHTTCGLFGAVPDVFTVPIGRLKQAGQLKGFPSETGQLIDLLLRMHMLEPNGNRAVWPVRIQGRDTILELNLVRFAHPGQILGPHEAVPPMPAELVAHAPAGTPATGDASVAAVEPPPPAAGATAAPEPAQANQEAKASDQAGPPAARHPAAPSAASDAAPTATDGSSAGGSGRAAEPVAAAVGESPRPVKEARPSRVQPVETDYERATAVLQQAMADIPKTNDGSHWVRAIVQRFIRGELRWGTHAQIVEGRVLLAFPTAFAGMGMDPADLRDQLFAQGWVEMDAVAQRLVVEIKTNEGTLRGAYFCELLTPVWTTVKEYQPLLNLPAVDATEAQSDAPAAGALRKIDAAITARAIGGPARSAPAEIVENLKLQVLEELRQAGLAKPLGPKASRNAVNERSQALGKALLQIRTQREFTKGDFHLLVTSSSNPLLIVQKGAEGSSLVLMNPDYQEPTFA